MPPVLPRLVEVGQHTYVLLEQIIAANLDTLFPGMEVLEHHLFRVTRNADLAIEEDEADDLLLAIEEELRKRRFGEAVRLEVERSMPAATRALLQRGLGLEPTDVYEVAGMLDLTALTRSPTWTCPTCSASRGSPSRRRASSRPTRTRRSTCSPPSARATCWSTTRTSRSAARSSGSSSRRPTTRTCWPSR